MTSYTIRAVFAVLVVSGLSGLVTACDPPAYIPIPTYAPSYTPAQSYAPTYTPSYTPAYTPAPAPTPVDQPTAAEQRPGGEQPPAATSNTFRAKQILGMKLSIQNNTNAGTVEDLVFDDAGNLEYVIVSTGENKLFTVPWDAVKWDMDKKTGTLNITEDVYKTIPTYTTTTYPQFYSPTYRTQVYKVYGLTPRELRRIERRIP